MAKRESTGKRGVRRSNSDVSRLMVPPHSVEAEQAVIGGLLLIPESWDLVGDLSETDFYRNDHRLIFRAIGDLAEKSQPFDAVTLGEWFVRNGLDHQVGGSSYLIELAANTPGAANIAAYASIVAEKARQRRLIEVGTGIVNSGFNPEGRTVDELFGEALQGLDSARSSREKPAGLRDVPLAAFMESPANTVGYAVHPVIPRGVVTLWGGHGGAGKSISALQIMAHGACGDPWQGLAPDGSIRCVYFSLEDPGNLVRYRLRRICESYSLDQRRVEANVRVFDCPDGKTSLMQEVSAFGLRRMEETPLLGQIRRLCEFADLIVIDNASDAFGGNENDRQAVRAFMGALGRIARECDAGLVLLAHIDKSAARGGAQGNTYSGSTAWHNSARSRLAIVANTDPELAAEVELRHEKNNLGKCADPILLKWNDHGVLMPLSQMDWAAKAKASDEPELAMAVLVAAHQQGIRVPTTTTGRYNAQKAVEHLPEFIDTFGKGGRKAGPRFNAALVILRNDGRVARRTEMSPTRKPVEVWSITDASALNAAQSAPNGAPNAVLNDEIPASAPPQGTPLGGSPVGGAGLGAPLGAELGAPLGAGDQDGGA